MTLGEESSVTRAKLLVAFWIHTIVSGVARAMITSATWAFRLRALKRA